MGNRCSYSVSSIASRPSSVPLWVLRYTDSKAALAVLGAWPLNRAGIRYSSALVSFPDFTANSPRAASTVTLVGVAA